MRFTRRTFAVLLLLGAHVTLDPEASGSQPLRVRVSPAFATCAEAALGEFTRRYGVAVRVEIGDPASVNGVDLVIGDDLELTRTLEGGLAEVRTAVDLGSVPWVLVSPAGRPDEFRGLADLEGTLEGPLYVLGGAAGREARAAIRLSPSRVVMSTDARALRGAANAVVPATLAGAGRHRTLDVRPLLAVAAVVTTTPPRREAQILLQFLGTADIRSAFRRCASADSVVPAQPEAATDGQRLRETAPGLAGYARSVQDWWLPSCSLSRNAYNDPSEVLGSPNAANLGGRDLYRGLMSLGQGGFVIVDMVQTIVDQPGADIRVYQATSGEPVTVYAANAPTGAFALLGLQRYCGNRTPGLFSNHCDFDLAEGGLATARYLKIEDGEIYPCLAAGTLSEGADIDAVESLNR